MSPARNLVPRPAFRAGDSSVGDWVTGIGQQSPTVADRDDSPTGSRLAWQGVAGETLFGVRVPLPGVTYRAGETYHVELALWKDAAASSSYGAAVIPEIAGELASGVEGGYTTILVRESYEHHTGVFTTPPADSFITSHMSPIPPESVEGAPAYLTLWRSAGGMSVWGSVAYVRLDRDGDNGLPGYFDGDTPDTTERVYEWDGTPRASTSTALLVNPDPEPDPEDPEDPPEDPEDPEDPPEDPEDPEDPEPDPWDEWDELSSRLAPRVAAFVGHPGNAELTATAAAQLPVVAEYVRGFTRGRGFTGEAPAGPLRAVIVSGAARLATNPEQVSVFTTGDYSERPAQLAGWTLAELGVLRRYRRVSA